MEHHTWNPRLDILITFTNLHSHKLGNTEFINLRKGNDQFVSKAIDFEKRMVLIDRIDEFVHTSGTVRGVLPSGLRLYLG